MGGCYSSELDIQLATDARAEAEKVKLLLLGAGESGKSTIFKQMKILYGVETTESERKELILTIQSNVVMSMKTLIDQAEIFKLEHLILDKNSLKAFKLRYCGESDNEINSEIISVSLWKAIKSLWQEIGIQQTWNRRAEFQIVDSVKEYFDDIDRLSVPNYLPTNHDILLSRVPTSGIVTEKYQIGKNKYEMYDVGGQRSERKKWIHCFDDVTAVIFVAALNEYNQKLVEDCSTNRMIEALALFEDTAKNISFSKSSFILFLNKKDLFAEKIKTNPIKDTEAFSDYTGGDDYHNATEYFLNKFKERFPYGKGQSKRQLYYHFTCATDTSDVKKVFTECEHVILMNNIKDSGWS